MTTSRFPEDKPPDGPQTLRIYATGEYSSAKKLFGAENHLCFYPKYFKQDFSKQVGLLVHELSHHYADITKDDYDWTGPGPDVLIKNAEVAQIYEEMGTLATNKQKVPIIFWSWISGWAAGAKNRK